MCQQVPYVHIYDTELFVRNISTSDHWDFPSIATFIPLHIHNVISLRVGPDGSEEADGWFWLAESSNRYYAKSAYLWLLERCRAWNPTENWNWVWRIHALEKVLMLIWLTLYALPTNSFRFHRGMATSKACARCFGEKEDVMHCLKDCLDSFSVWKYLGFIDMDGFQHANVTW